MNSYVLKDIRFLVTQDADRRIMEHVDIRIVDGRIAEIGEDLSATGEELVDCSGKVVLPGLINTHTHAPMNLLRGISDDKVLQDWLEDEIFPVEALLTAEDLAWGTKHAMLEMIQTGTTTFNDMYAPEKPVAEAVDAAGMRAMLGRGVMDIRGSGADKLAATEDLLETYGDHDRITPSVAPHAIYTCSGEFLGQCRDLARQYDAPIHIHVSETGQENEDCQEAHGTSPTQYLHDLGLLTNRTVAAHGVHLSDADIAVFAETGAAIAHNPASNLKLGSGVARLADLEDVTVGIGTDSVASNNNLNLFEEARLAGLLQKRQDPRQMSAQTVLDMVTRDGATTLGLADEIGSVEAGKAADLITVPLECVSMGPHWGTDGLVSNLIYGFDGRIADMFVAGTRLLADGEFQTLDADRIKQEAQARADRLQEERD